MWRVVPKLDCTLWSGTYRLGGGFGFSACHRPPRRLQGARSPAGEALLSSDQGRLFRYSHPRARVELGLPTVCVVGPPESPVVWGNRGGAVGFRQQWALRQRQQVGHCERCVRSKVPFGIAAAQKLRRLARGVQIAHRPAPCPRVGPTGQSPPASAPNGTDGADLPVRIGGRRSVWATERFAGKRGARDGAWSGLIGSAPPPQDSSGPIGLGQLHRKVSARPVCVVTRSLPASHAFVARPDHSLNRMKSRKQPDGFRGRRSPASPRRRRRADTALHCKLSAVVAEGPPTLGHGKLHWDFEEMWNHGSTMPPCRPRPA